MIRLITKTAAAIHIEQSVGHSDNHAHFRLHIFGQRLERDLARLENQPTRVNEENAVGVRIDLKFGHALLGRILLVFGIVGRILNEAV
jgi:hypothetical protein